MVRDKFNQQTTLRTNQKIAELGRSMVEMLAVLAIMGILAAIGVSLISTVKAKIRANTADQHVGMASINLRLSLGGQENAKFDVPDSDVSLASTNEYKNAGIVVDFGDDVQACKQFMLMYQNRSEYHVLNKCEE